jgi:hypothetical protein
MTKCKKTRGPTFIFLKRRPLKIVLEILSELWGSILFDTRSIAIGKKEAPRYLLL